MRMIGGMSCSVTLYAVFPLGSLWSGLCYTVCCISSGQSLVRAQEDLLYHVMVQPNSKDAVHSVLGMNRQVGEGGREGGG